MNDKESAVLNSFDKFLTNCYKELEKNNLNWVVIGSLASYLQGCHIIPNDIDIVPKEPETIQVICKLMKEFHTKERTASSSITNEDKEELWLSSEEKPIDYSTDDWGFDWIFARWLVNNTKIEIAHITPPEGFLEKSEGIWEAGPEIWPYVKKIPYKKYYIPVVPLEIQLETNLNRNLKERVDEIISIFKREGYKKEVIKKALSEKNRNLLVDLLK